MHLQQINLLVSFSQRFKRQTKVSGCEKGIDYIKGLKAKSSLGHSIL